MCKLIESGVKNVAKVSDFKQYEVSVLVDGVVKYTVQNDIIPAINKLYTHENEGAVELRIVCKEIQRRQTAKMWLDRLFNYVESQVNKLQIPQTVFSNYKEKIYKTAKADINKKNQLMVISCWL